MTKIQLELLIATARAVHNVMFWRGQYLHKSKMDLLETLIDKAEKERDDSNKETTSSEGCDRQRPAGS